MPFPGHGIYGAHDVRDGSPHSTGREPHQSNATPALARERPLVLPILGSIWPYLAAIGTDLVLKQHFTVDLRPQWASRGRDGLSAWCRAMVRNGALSCVHFETSNRNRFGVGRH